MASKGGELGRGRYVIKSPLQQDNARKKVKRQKKKGGTHWERRMKEGPIHPSAENENGASSPRIDKPIFMGEAKP